MNAADREQPGGDRDRETVPVDALSYTEASAELDEIVAFFERGELDVDQLVGRLERAAAIVDELDRRLRRTKSQVEELVPRLEAAIGAPERADEEVPMRDGPMRDVPDETPGLF